MKLIHRTITLLGIAVALGVPLAVHAQPSQTNPARPRPSLTKPTLPKNNSQLGTKPDLSFLLPTVTAYLKNNLSQTESEMQVRGTSPGSTFTINARLKVIAKYPNNFRAEIAFTQPGSASSNSYLVVANGTKTWIYSPSLKQYAVMSYADFQKSDDSFLIGLSSLFFLEAPQDVRSLVAQGKLSPQDFLTSVAASNDTSLKGGRRTVAGQQYYVYEIKEPKEDYTLNVFVEPKTAKLDQLQLTGKSEGLDVVVTEKIIRRITNPVVSASTFSFTPPQGTKLVKSLPLNPF
jgi:outer membrane lipoprotein-sorting protein